MIKQISVLEHSRINVVSGLFAGIDILELSVIPFLLNNNSVWAEMLKGIYELLEDLYRFFPIYVLYSNINTIPIPQAS